MLGAKLNAKQRALLHLALSFHTWRALVQEAGLKPAAAVEAMVEVVEGAGSKCNRGTAPVIPAKLVPAQVALSCHGRARPGHPV